MFLAGHPSEGCFGLQSHCAPCYFFNQASFYPSDFSFTTTSAQKEPDPRFLLLLLPMPPDRQRPDQSPRNSSWKRAK
ncbi:hypothetical protein TNCV_4261411 [Trichonephila clavipes]|nr:hypothetical protein TNCV_4261411 [Trichonephila clavipes]